MARRLFSLSLSLSLSTMIWAATAVGQSEPDAIQPGLTVAGSYSLSSANASLDEKQKGSGDDGFTAIAAPISVDPLTGSVTTTVSIGVPAGRLGMTPALAVKYSSRNGNGTFGLGWAWAGARVERDLGGGPPLLRPGSTSYDDTAGFVLILGGFVVDLDVPLSNQPGCANAWGSTDADRYFTACFEVAQNRWTVKLGDGQAHTFGAPQGPDGTSARSGMNPVYASGTAVWHQTSAADLNGNTIDFDYVKDAGHVYPQYVHYGGNAQAGYPHLFHVGIIRQTAVRADPIISYRAGFEDRTEHLVSSIVVWADGYATESSPTWRYRFTYDSDSWSAASRLAQVDLERADGSDLVRPSTFSYTDGTPQIGTMQDVPGLPSGLGLAHHTIMGQGTGLIVRNRIERDQGFARS